MPARASLFARASVPARAALYWLLAALACAAITWPLLSQHERGLERITLAREQGHLDLVDALVRERIAGVSGDTRILAGLDRIREYLTAPSPELQRLLEHQLSRFALTYDRYDQLRVLDASGQERVRINHREGQLQVVPHERLQDKADRDYVQDGFRLAQEGFLLSPIDLNQEDGAIEQPLRPVIRGVAPVYNREGTRLLGLVVLNYRADLLLQVFRSQISHSSHTQGMLVNASGHFLVHPDRTLEWGWQLGHAEQTLAARHPAEAAQIEAGERGTIKRPQGVYLFDTIRPAAIAGSAPSIAPAALDAPRWKLVVFVPRHAWRDGSPVFRPTGWLVGALFLLAVAIAAWALATQQAQRQSIRRERARQTEVLADLYENAPCGYHTLDAEGTILRMNRTELDWLGYALDDLAERRAYRDLIAAEYRPAFEAALSLIRAEGAPVSDLLLDLTRRDGSPLPVSMNAAPMRDPITHRLVIRATVTNIAERRRLEIELREQARTDPMTGTANRRAFYEQAEHALQRARRSGRPIALLMLDIDHFKAVNDRFGHDAGDEVLRQFSKRCLDQLRAKDLFARFGGEEFVALLPEAGREQALGVAERIRSSIAGTHCVLGDAREVRISVSIGVALNTDVELEPGHPHGLDALLKLADDRLYRAKNGGRNRVMADSA